jgi:hypothetical protein
MTAARHADALPPFGVLLVFRQARRDDLMHLTQMEQVPPLKNRATSAVVVPMAGR